LRLRLVDRATSAKATATLFAHAVVQKRRPPTGEDETVAYAHGGGLLPLPPTATIDLPEHDGWAHTRVLDVAVNLSDVQPYVTGLEVVRRYPGIQTAPPAFTYVDVLRAPFNRRARIPDSGNLTERHVLVVLYDAAAPVMQIGVQLAQAPAGEDVVIVFRADSQQQRPPSMSSEFQPTFLRVFFDLVAWGSHASYTLVGLEGIPPAVLAQELRLDPHDTARRAAGSGPEWAAFVADHTFPHIGRLYQTRHIDGLTKTLEHVRVLTMDEFRAEVGEEAWVRETMADVVF
jgi:hypothetical protein